MAEGGEIASLFAVLGLRVNSAQWAQGNEQIDKTKRSLDSAFQDSQGRWRAASGRFLTMSEKAAAGIKGVGEAAAAAGDKAASAGHRATRSFDAAGAALKGLLIYMGASFGYERLIKFNSTVEDSKNQIAGMLALTKKTNLSDELGNANMLMADLQQRAAKLPGTTAEYVSMLGNITRPIIDAKLSMKDLEDITVGSVVAAKALGVDAGAAARDIDQALRGQYHSVDQFTGKILGSIGYEGEEGRAKFNALDKAKRAEELKRAINQPQIQQLAEAQGKTFSGVLSTLEDSIQQFFGKVGGGLFGRLKTAIEQINAWLDAHQERILQIANTIGDALAGAFEFLGSAISVVIDYGGAVMEWIGQFVDGSELLKSALIAIGIVLTVFAIQSAIAFATNPITLVILAITALVYAIRWLIKHPEQIKKAFNDAFDALTRAAGAVADAIKTAFVAAFDFVANLPVISQLIDIINWVRGAPSATDRQIMHDDHASPDELYRKYGSPPAKPGSDQPAVSPAPPVRMLAPSATSYGPTSLNVNVGDINVHSPNADPVAVGDQVRKVFHEELGNTLRKTMDVYG